MAERGKLEKALSALAARGKLCAAFSGGVDSALLVKLACGLGLEVHAVTFDSTLQPAQDAARAARQAAEYGARHLILPVDPLAHPLVRSNSRDRCYHCKRALFAALREYAREQGIDAVIDGTNADDLEQYRPGLRALRELSIESPLARLGFTKKDVRALAEEIGLDVARRPSSPCLATRFPYGAVLTPEALDRCGKAEEWMRALGFPVVRVRVHDGLARVEVLPEMLETAAKTAGKIEEGLRRLGYRYVTLDLAGYRSGCYDQMAEGDLNENAVS